MVMVVRCGCRDESVDEVEEGLDSDESSGKRMIIMVLTIVMIDFIYNQL